MENVVLVIHLILALSLIGIVLIQHKQLLKVQHLTSCTIVT